jgi:hypothetical protein
MPLVVLSHDPHKGFNPYIPVDAKAELLLQERHEDLARLSSRGRELLQKEVSITSSSTGPTWWWKRSDR